MKLIVNADDFGISKAVTLGILEAYKNGIVRSTTLMCNMPAAEYAANIAKENPGLGVGIHFVLTAGYPLSEGVDSLVDESGKFKKTGIQEKSAKIDDVRKEFRAQMDKFLSFGIKPTHIDSHHHVHGAEQIFEVVKEMALEYNLPVRLALNEDIKFPNDIKTTSAFEDGFYGNEKITPENIIKLIDENKDKESFEIMSHPAYLDQQILNSSSYALPRTKELETLTSDEVKNYINENNIDLISYKNL